MINKVVGVDVYAPTLSLAGDYGQTHVHRAVNLPPVHLGSVEQSALNKYKKNFIIITHITTQSKQ